MVRISQPRGRWPQASAQTTALGGHFCSGAEGGGAGFRKRGHCLPWPLLIVRVRRTSASPGAEGPLEFTIYQDNLVM